MKLNPECNVKSNLILAMKFVTDEYGFLIKNKILVFTFMMHQVSTFETIFFCPSLNFISISL